MTAKELEAVAKVMRAYGVMDFATADTRITLSANASVPLPGFPIDPLLPVRASSTSPQTAIDEAQEEDELLFASSGGPPPR
jgi:hypothetical protein